MESQFLLIAFVSLVLWTIYDDSKSVVSDTLHFVVDFVFIIKNTNIYSRKSQRRPTPEKLYL